MAYTDLVLNPPDDNGDIRVYNSTAQLMYTIKPNIDGRHTVLDSSGKDIGTVIFPNQIHRFHRTKLREFISNWNRIDKYNEHKKNISDNPKVRVPKRKNPGDLSDRALKKIQEIPTDTLTFDKVVNDPEVDSLQTAVYPIIKSDSLDEDDDLDDFLEMYPNTPEKNRVPYHKSPFFDFFCVIAFILQIALFTLYSCLLLYTDIFKNPLALIPLNRSDNLEFLFGIFLPIILLFTLISTLGILFPNPSVNFKKDVLTFVFCPLGAIGHIIYLRLYANSTLFFDIIVTLSILAVIFLITLINKKIISLIFTIIILIFTFLFGIHWYIPENYVYVNNTEIIGDWFVSDEKSVAGSSTFSFFVESTFNSDIDQFGMYRLHSGMIIITSNTDYEIFRYKVEENGEITLRFSFRKYRLTKNNSNLSSNVRAVNSLRQIITSNTYMNQEWLSNKIIGILKDYEIVNNLNRSLLYSEFPEHLLKIGHTSDEVYIVQKYLDLLGTVYPNIQRPDSAHAFHYEPTGAFTLDTANCVESFQRMFNLPITGSVDEITWNRLVSESENIGVYDIGILCGFDSSSTGISPDGDLINIEDTTWFYYGYIFDDKPHGIGHIEYDSGIWYRGYWEDGVLQGEVEYGIGALSFGTVTYK